LILDTHVEDNHYVCHSVDLAAEYMTTKEIIYRVQWAKKTITNRDENNRGFSQILKGNDEMKLTEKHQ